MCRVWILPVPACQVECEEAVTTGFEEPRVQSCPFSLGNQRAYWMIEDLKKR